MASSSAASRAFDEARLERLIAALCDDAISSPELAELQEILTAHQAARTRFLEEMCVHAGLEWETAARTKLAALIESCGAAALGSTAALPAPIAECRRGRLWRVRRALDIALTTTALAAAAALLILSVRNHDDTRRSTTVGSLVRPSAAVPERFPIVAILSPMTPDCHWLLENYADLSRSEARSGDTLRLTGGELKVVFSSGAAVTLSAPAILEVVSPMRGRILRGRATVNVPNGAEGFTIDTPRTSVVDYGTVFGVEVDDFGRTDVVVFNGIVDVAYSHSNVVSEYQVSKQRLYMGEAVRVDERGTLSRIVSLSSDRFPASRDGMVAARSRVPLISTVRDNIERENTWNFYEIVPEGMREDAKAYVDRLGHEWNGLDASGMPSYLLGGDYVKTFNDDKNIGGIEVFVTLDRPAMLYVLFDDRVEPPSWLRDEFEDTGDDIGVDETRHVFKDGVVYEAPGPEVGPGVSVERPHSVWKRAVTNPGVVRLGPTGSDTWNWNVNMYGIVAVPLAGTR